MGFPYAFIRIFQGKEPFLKRGNRTVKGQAKYLMKPDNMHGKYLGACLDSCRWGGQTTVMWEMNIKEMISFIQAWFEQNKKIFKHLFHERKIKDLYKRFDLPHIHDETCRRDNKHTETIKDLAGRLRCAHETKKYLKPSFITSYNPFDRHAQMDKFEFYESEPLNPLPTPDPFDDAMNMEDIIEMHKEEYEAYQEELYLYETEKPVEIRNICYSIISDKHMILPLETILRRLNLEKEGEVVYCNYFAGPCKRIDELSPKQKEDYAFFRTCPGHYEPINRIVFPFDGWDLAFYVQKWWEQLPGDKTPQWLE